MVQQLLEEVKAAPLDEAGRKRLATVLHTSITELKDGLAPELDDELDRLIEPFDEDTPSESELRIAQAQLVGWLEGLFHGIQTAIYAQQMAARSQLEQMRRALPPGAIPGLHGHPQQDDDDGRSPAPRAACTSELHGQLANRATAKGLRSVGTDAAATGGHASRDPLRARVRTSSAVAGPSPARRPRSSRAAG